MFQNKSQYNVLNNSIIFIIPTILDYIIIGRRTPRTPRSKRRKKDDGELRRWMVMDDDGWMGAFVVMFSVEILIILQERLHIFKS